MQRAPMHACVLSPQPPPHVICDLAHKALERGAADDRLGRSLILADLPSYQEMGRKRNVENSHYRYRKYRACVIIEQARYHLSATVPGFVLRFRPFLSILTALLEGFFPAGRFRPWRVGACPSISNIREVAGGKWVQYPGIRKWDTSKYAGSSQCSESS